MGVLTSGKEINIDPKAGTKAIKDVSEALKDSYKSPKASPLVGAKEFASTTPDPSDSKLGKGSWIKGGDGKFERANEKGTTSFS